MVSSQIESFIIPDWPAPEPVHSIITTKNFGSLAADRPDNRQQLAAVLKLPNPPRWLNQIHGAIAVNLDQNSESMINADASYTHTPGTVCAIITADCLPILICNRQGTEIAAVHAGWRGLLAGVIDSAINHFKSDPDLLMVWLGPAIGPDHFEINEEIRRNYCQRHSDYGQAFYYRNNSLYANLYQLARINLAHCGVKAVFGGDFCTYCDEPRFYSYRREHQADTGKKNMATLIWRA